MKTGNHENIWRKRKSNTKTLKLKLNLKVLKQAKVSTIRYKSFTGNSKIIIKRRKKLVAKHIHYLVSELNGIICRKPIQKNLN